MDQVMTYLSPALAWLGGVMGLKGAAWFGGGMFAYHQMLKRSPRLLSWLLSGVKSAGDAAKDAIKG